MLLARARSARGDIDCGMEALNAAAELAERTGELVHLPIILAERARAFRAFAGNHAAAEADQRRAMGLAAQFGIDRRVLASPESPPARRSTRPGVRVAEGVPQ
jgi:hypothetical protein